MKKVVYSLLVLGVVIVGIIGYSMVASSDKNTREIKSNSSVKSSSSNKEESRSKVAPDNKLEPTIKASEEKINDKNIKKPEPVNVTGLKKGGIADALLTKDALMGVVMELALAGCDEYNSHEAYMLKNPVMVSEKEGSWQERWVVSGCENKYQVDLNFHEIIGQGTNWTIIK
jgi:hypothetical protein